MMHGFVIGGTHSGSGKTTLTLGLLRALARRGLRVQPFKVGPDYIDTGWHSRVSGVISRNLDAFMLPEDSLRTLFWRQAAKADVAVIEGVMGLFDGLGTDPLACSTAGMARLLDCPVILAVDGKAVSTSAAATVQGFANLVPGIKVTGVLLNRVNSPSHYALLKEAIEQHTGIPVLGRLPLLESIRLPERHLGLITVQDELVAAPQWDALADAITEYVDLEALLALCRLSEDTEAEQPALPAALRGAGEGLTLALAEDEAFNFYYPDNLDLLEACGVRLVRFSPLHDTELPQCDLLYLGGGYPELYGERLAGNHRMRQAMLAAHHAGVAIYAECGGLMYLGEQLIDQQGQHWPMVGVLPGTSRMGQRLTRFGYCHAEALQDTSLAACGERLRGHEFHYSDFATELTPVFTFSKHGSSALPDWQGGYQLGNTLASYLHLHFWQAPQMLLHWFARGRTKA